ncbi:hypothetical protein [Rhizobium sp. SG741]|uniref:hypothetical protein n=1 Tax=Rhizobium sp. SG741 TaxID=2587114 RepID=UPI001446A42C|nr:hypothetical protein [Rhizobium sp. SG741]
MICERDLAEPPSLGIAVDPFPTLGNAMPHEDVGGFYPLLKMVTSSKRILRHTGIERDEEIDLRVIIDDPQEQFLHISTNSAPLARCLKALPINPQSHQRRSFISILRCPEATCSIWSQRPSAHR